jgi:hypothetical protein
VRVDQAGRRLSATAAALPGLGLDGYRALEKRAGVALPDWTVALAPPADTPLPDIAIRQGVIDDVTLGIAAWGSARTGRSISVRGGTRAQRSAIAEGIVARGGRAEPGPAAGPLALAWVADPGAAGTEMP